MKVITWIFWALIILVVFGKIIPGMEGCGSGCNSSKKTTLVQQGFTVQDLNSRGQVISSAHYTTPWAGEIPGFYRILPDSANVVVVVLPGYYVANRWSPATETTLEGHGEDPSLPETGQSQPMPTRGFGLVQIVSGKKNTQ